LTRFPLPPNATIGLVGGGQLGRMSALAAARLGYRCHILTRETDSPAAQVSAGVTISDYTDPESLRAFAAAVDVISFEFENISAEGLDLLESLKPVRPSPSILRISQDRIVEKSFVNGLGVRTAPWRPAGSLAELDVYKRQARGAETAPDRGQHRLPPGDRQRSVGERESGVRRCRPTGDTPSATSRNVIPRLVRGTSRSPVLR